MGASTLDFAQCRSSRGVLPTLGLQYSARSAAHARVARPRSRGVVAQVMDGARPMSAEGRAVRSTVPLDTPVGSDAKLQAPGQHLDQVEGVCIHTYIYMRACVQIV